MMQDPRTGEWLPLPQVIEIPFRALEGRLCPPPPQYPQMENIQEMPDEITGRRRRL